MEQDVEIRLSNALGLSLTQFIETFGAGWQPVDGPESRPVDEDDEQWFLAGDPPQLMMRIGRYGACVARPSGQWHGVANLTYSPQDVFRLSGSDAEDGEAIARLLSARRSSFRYCSICRGVTPPEWRHGRVCMSCSERWLGFVH